MAIGAPVSFPPLTFNQLAIQHSSRRLASVRLPAAKISVPSKSLGGERSQKLADGCDVAADALTSRYSADTNPRGARVLVGPINELGSMITGRFVITEDKHDLCSEVGMISINFKLYCALYFNEKTTLVKLFSKDSAP